MFHMVLHGIERNRPMVLVVVFLIKKHVTSAFSDLREMFHFLIFEEKISNIQI